MDFEKHFRRFTLFYFARHKDEATDTSKILSSTFGGVYDIKVQVGTETWRSKGMRLTENKLVQGIDSFLPSPLASSVSDQLLHSGVSESGEQGFL